MRPRGQGLPANVVSGDGALQGSTPGLALPLPGSVWYLLSRPTSPSEDWATSPPRVASSGSLTYDRSSTCGQSQVVTPVQCLTVFPPPTQQATLSAHPGVPVHTLA